MEIPTNTCIGCKKRHVNCHADCKDYQDFKEQYEVYKTWLRGQRSTQRLAGVRPWRKVKHNKGGE